MIIDKKGRLFGKISLIDIFAVVVLIMVFMVVYLNIGTNARAAAAGREQPVVITFFKDSLENFTVEALERGARVENDTDGTFMGNIINIEVGESINFMPDIDGNEVASPMEGHSSVTIQTQVMGRMVDGTVLLNGNLYGNGTQIIIWAGIAKIQLFITDVSPVEM
ncbi:MAG: DUF4330 domain-containing protein [Defluviitaleaceae bacterium]|nr:DUF4330 domain-containing protein [Defluviitaleaceae bacterium]